MASPKIPDLPGRGPDPGLVSVDAKDVIEELGRILQSRHFKSCTQGKRFLQYIVQQTLRGNSGLLKERLLGTALFDRPPDYATGEDSVVRVQANDVRRRLQAYRAESTHPSPILIELPVGSYVPAFHKAQPIEAAPIENRNPAEPPVLRNVPGGPEIAAKPSGEHEPGSPQPVPAYGRRDYKRHWGLFFLLALTIIGCVAFTLAYRWRTPNPPGTGAAKLSESFWEPLLSSPTPVVICLGKTAVYRPSDSLYHRYTKTHPGQFLTNNEKLTRPLPLASTDPLHWGDLVSASSYGFTIGSVRSAIDLAGYLAQQHKAYDVRLGVESSFADLRNFPAVLVGAFNNRWTMELNSDLHFTFVEGSGQLGIRERAPSPRSWTWQRDPSGNVLRDYGVVTRQTVWKTGQAVISVAGIGDGGTEAATEMVTKPDELAEVLKLLPGGWEKKNLQLVVSTDMTDGEAGRPRLVAYYLW